MVEELFARAMDLDEPWIVSEVKLDATAGRVNIVIDLVRVARFAVPGEDGMNGAYDTQTN